MDNNICKSIVESDDEILGAVILRQDEKDESYFRPGIPLPDEFRKLEMITQTRIIISMVLKTQDYLGRLKFIHYRMENVDVLHFSLSEGRIFVALLRPQGVAAPVIKKIQQMVKELIATMM